MAYHITWNLEISADHVTDLSLLDNNRLNKQLGYWKHKIDTEFWWEKFPGKRPP
jgi:hypothetical protein